MSVCLRVYIIKGLMSSLSLVMVYVFMNDYHCCLEVSYFLKQKLDNDSPVRVYEFKTITKMSLLISHLYLCKHINNGIKPLNRVGIILTLLSY